MNGLPWRCCGRRRCCRWRRKVSCSPEGGSAGRRQNTSNSASNKIKLDSSHFNTVKKTCKSKCLTVQSDTLKFQENLNKMSQNMFFCFVLVFFLLIVQRCRLSWSDVWNLVPLRGLPPESCRIRWEPRQTGPLGRPRNSWSTSCVRFSDLQRRTSWNKQSRRIMGGDWWAFVSVSSCTHNHLGMYFSVVLIRYWYQKSIPNQPKMGPLFSYLSLLTTDLCLIWFYHLIKPFQSFHTRK